MSLKDSEWHLRAFKVLDCIEPVLPGTSITLTFSETRVKGSAGCNFYDSDATYDEGNNGAINVLGVGITEILCTEPPGILSQEDRFVEFLQAAKTFSRTDTMLILTDETSNEERVLIFDVS